MNCYVLIGERPQQNWTLSDSGTFAMVFDTQQELRNYQKQHPLERFDNPPVEVDRQWMIDQKFNTFVTGQTEFYSWLLVSPVRAALITVYIQSVFAEWKLELSRTNQKIGKKVQQWSTNGK